MPLQGDAVTILDETVALLFPLLRRILQSDTIPLIGAGFMCVAPGALAQELHKDVHGHDRHGCVGELTRSGGGARAVSVQIQLTDTTGPTAAGSLELLPGSHRPECVLRNSTLWDPARIHPRSPHDPRSPIPAARSPQPDPRSPIPARSPADLFRSPL